MKSEQIWIHSFIGWIINNDGWFHPLKMNVRYSWMIFEWWDVLHELSYRCFNFFTINLKFLIYIFYNLCWGCGMIHVIVEMLVLLWHSKPHRDLFECEQSLCMSIVNISCLWCSDACRSFYIPKINCDIVQWCCKLNCRLTWRLVGHERCIPILCNFYDKVTKVLNR